MQKTGAGQRADGFDITPLHDFVFVADYGQPDKTKGGILYGDVDGQFHRYRASEWRHGEVIAIGLGRRRGDGRRDPMPNIQIGDVILFSRKHGARLPGSMRFHHPKYSDEHPASKGLLIRVLDSEKCQAVCEDFEPWWNVLDSQLDPSNDMSG